MFYGIAVHKKFIQVCAVDGSGAVTREFRIEARRPALETFGATLGSEDSLVLEATFHSWAIYTCWSEAGAQVIVANPIQVKAIAHARIKTDKVDARILAQLLRAGFIPEIRMPDRAT